MHRAPVTVDSGGHLSRTGRHYARRILAVLASAAIAFGAVLVPSAAAVADIPGVTLSVSPSAGGLLRPEQNLVVTIDVSTTDPLADAFVSVDLGTTPLVTQAALQDWVANGGASRSVYTAATEPLVAGQTEFTISIPSESIALTDADRWGPRGLTVSLSSAGETTTVQSAIVWYPSTSVGSASITAVVPLTAPLGTTGILTADQLTALTAPDGWLTAQLSSIASTTAAVAIDPMIIASIRLLGTSAPASVTAWLTSLSEMSNETLPLAWADADQSSLVAAGSAPIFLPDSLAFAIDPALIALPPTETPAPTTSPDDPPILPTVAELSAWDWTWPDLTWPRQQSVTEATLDALTSAGKSTVIVSSDNLQAGSVPVAHATVADTETVVTDSATSEYFSGAVLATDTGAWRADSVLVSASSAAAVIEGAEHLLVGVARPTTAQDFRFGETLRSATSLPWLEPAALRTVFQTDSPARQLAKVSDEALRTDSFDQMLTSEQAVDRYSSALVQPDLLTSAQRATLLAVGSVGWAGDPAGWTTTLAAHFTQQDALLAAVSIEPLSNILVVTSQTAIPVSISNQFPYPVVVIVSVTPSNSRLIVDPPMTVTIEASSKKTVRVPVTVVANGEARLTVRITSTTGYPLDDPVSTPITLRAEWEGIVVVLVIAAVLLLLGFGLWRNIVRRRRAASAEANDPEAATADGSERPDAADQDAAHDAAEATGPAGSTTAPDEEPRGG